MFFSKECTSENGFWKEMASISSKSGPDYSENTIFSRNNSEFKPSSLVAILTAT